ncbi:MAG TPA: type II toxin-antitoxin system PemK/MazF family toxin [Longimicrobium sp.]
MEIHRGEVWWADLEEPRGSEPGYRRPIVIIQSDPFNRSNIATVLGAVLTSSLRLADVPGNVFVPARTAGLRKDSVINVSQLVTVDREFLGVRIGRLPERLMAAVDAGLKLILDLS